MTIPFQDPHTKAMLELRNALGQAGLRNMRGVRGGAEGAVSGNRKKVQQSTWIDSHARYPRSRPTPDWNDPPPATVGRSL